MLSDEERQEAAALLAHAEAERQPIRPLVETYPAMDVVDSYEIALLNIRERLDRGAVVLGHKVGLSSEAMQQMMGVDEPDYGHLLDDMALAEDRPVDASRYRASRDHMAARSTGALRIGWTGSPGTFRLSTQAAQAPSRGTASRA